MYYYTYQIILGVIATEVVQFDCLSAFIVKYSWIPI